MPCSWEGNRRSGVALAMRHMLRWVMQSTYGHLSACILAVFFLFFFDMLFVYLCTCIVSFSGKGGQH